MKSAPESKAMLEVWEWKEKAWQEVAHLPLREAIRESLRRSQETARELGFVKNEKPGFLEKEKPVSGMEQNS